MNDKNRSPLVLLISILDLLDLLRTLRKAGIRAVRVKQLDAQGHLIPGSKRSIWRLYGRYSWKMLELSRLIRRTNPDYPEAAVPYQEMLVTKNPLIAKGTVIVMDTSRVDIGIGELHDKKQEQRLQELKIEPLNPTMHYKYEMWDRFGISNPYWPKLVGKKDQN